MMILEDFSQQRENSKLCFMLQSFNILSGNAYDNRPTDRN
jgi:hypothetical protein